MLITMRLPQATAEKMGIAVGAGTDEVEVTLPAVEMAGRMSLATGRAISPQDLENYCASLETHRSPADALVERDRGDPERQIRAKRPPRRSSRAVDESAVDWVSGALTECYL